ncbi:unnamed protein product [Adineta steineri]|uniref:Retrotransposon gag domain-containing protein n=1 Tax=Adineta steineri TaxID=433720 RepID=A0A819ZD09_9BILA|nr:unnamed protein product [Adineta steineri]
MESPSNEELHGVTPEDPLFLVPNNEVNQLRRHTRAYLKSISQIPTIYQIPRARSSQRRTRPYDENETLATTIDDLILDTISKIRDLIATIEHQGETGFPNFLDLPEGDSNFQDFPEAEEGGSGPPEPPENNTTCASPTSPIPNFKFIATMAANIPWLATDSVAVLRAQHPLPKHLENFLPKFDPDNDISPENRIKQFMLSLRLLVVQHEDVVCILFPYTFVGHASTWFFSLAPGSISSWQQFKTAFIS